MARCMPIVMKWMRAARPNDIFPFPYIGKDHEPPKHDEFRKFRRGGVGTTMMAHGFLSLPTLNDVGTVLAA